MVEKLLHYCVTRLVDKPDAVTVEHKAMPEKELYEVRVSAQDLAKVIGKGGRTFKALRSLINTVDPENRNDLVVDAIDA